MPARLRRAAAIGCLALCLGSCTSVEPGAADGKDESTSVETETPTPAPLPTRYVPTRIEKQVIDRFREAGARDVGVAEPGHGSSAANISLTWMGQQLFVVAYPTAREWIYERRQEVLGEITVDGVTIVEAEQFRRRNLTLECQGLKYKVNKAIGDPWDAELMSSFLVGVAKSAGC